MNPDVITKRKAEPYKVKHGGEATIKDVDLQSRIVTGLYNTAYWFDSDQDVALPGVNAKSINDRGPKSSAVQKIKHLANHEWKVEKMPGRIITLEEKGVEINGRKVFGTYFETKMSDTTFGRDMLINYMEGVYDQHSEGFQYREGLFIDNGDEDWEKYVSLLLNPKDAEEVGYMFLWSEWMMLEGSTVPFGANSLTPYLGVKSGNKDALAIKVLDRVDQLEKQLKNGTQSDDTMQSFQMEVLQLKQLIKELFEASPSEKDTLKKGRQDKDTEPKLEISKLLNIF